MMVFQSFTWQQFLVAALILGLVWYALVGLIFYRSEIRAFLSGAKPGGYQPLSHGWEDQVDELAPSLMGESRLNAGESVLEADAFSFVAAGSTGEAAVDPLGDLADVQQEIKHIVTILEKEDGTKDDFFSLFALVRAKYPKVAVSDRIPELNVFIREHAPFHLSAEEMEGLWV